MGNNAQSSVNPLALIGRGFARALTFRGRASRAEFNWFVLFAISIVVLGIVADDYLSASGTWFPYGRVMSLILTLPMAALSVRRLHDTGLSGWILLPAILPVVGLLAVLFLAIRKTRSEAIRYDDPARGRLRYRVAALAILGFAAIGVSYHPYWIPAGSMKPTLLIGDYLFVSRIAYGVPCFGLCGPDDRLGAGGPDRGDVIVFRHPVNGTDFIKRVIGLPGDRVQMRDGVLFVNDMAAAQVPDAAFVERFEPQGPGGFLPRCSNAPVGQGEDCIADRFTETLPGGTEYSVLNLDDSAIADNTAEFTVPEGQYFVMGDNRDNSADSRLPRTSGGVGFVPRQNIIGRADWIVYSFAGQRMLDIRNWRSDRYFRRVE